MAETHPVTWVPIKKTIGPSATLIADSIPLSKINSVNYIVSLFSTSSIQKKYLKLSVYKDDTDVSDSVFNRHGNLNVSVNAIVTGSDMQLQLVNNELFSVDVKLLRSII